jgi:ABC-2 type transport system ATP-binding protein
VVETATPQDLGGAARAGATVHWTEGGAARAERTDRPTEVVRRLLARPDLLVAGEVPGLEVRRPTLEDAYLALVDGVTSR